MKYKIKLFLKWLFYAFFKNIPFRFLLLLFVARHRICSTVWQGRKIKIPDSASFLSACEEIIVQGIYNFRAKSEQPVILDCGANVGVSLIFFKQKYPKAQITAFEPDPEIANFLEYNLQQFGFQDITVFRKAVWTSETELRFETDGADGGRITEKTDAKTKTISTVRLRDFLEKPIDFLKIDIEGAEYEVLKDIADRLLQVQNIFVEYHSFTNQPQHLDEILQILSQAGFRYYMQNSGIQSITPFTQIRTMQGMDLQINISAYRP